MINQQSGWSVESKLLQYILKQLKRLTEVVGTNNLGFLTNIVEDTSPQLGGDLDVNGYNIDWGTILTTNGAYSGDILTVTVDTNSIGEGCLLSQGVDFHYDEADANSITTAYNLCLALESGTGTKKVLLKGQYCNTSWSWIYGPIYASETTGELSQSLPITEDAVVAVVGWALSANTIYFNPYNAWATVYADTTTTTTTSAPTTTTTTTSA